MSFPSLVGDSTLGTALGVLSAMITPAVLILACGSLLITTSNRLSRVIDRVRELSREIEDLSLPSDEDPLLDERREMLFELLDYAMQRGRILQRAVTSLYSALGTFLATSFAVGVLALVRSEQATLAVVLSFVGSALMLIAAGLMILEARIGLFSLDIEIEFLKRRGRRHAPPGRTVRRRNPWWQRNRRDASLP